MKLPSLVRLSFGTATGDDDLIAKVELELEIAEEEYQALRDVLETFDKQQMQALYEVRDASRKLSEAKEALKKERDEAKLPKRRLDVTTQYNHWTILNNAYNWALRAYANVVEAATRKGAHTREIEKRLRALRGEVEEEPGTPPPLPRGARDTTKNLISQKKTQLRGV